MGWVTQNDNLGTFSDGRGLTCDEEVTLMKALDLFKSQIHVPCTGCRYCVPDCPMQINIPEYLKLYNNYTLEGKWALQGASEIQSEGQPSDCIGCGSCVSQCPQNITTPEIMKELAGLL